MFDITWSQFTPWASLAGGALIGLATALYLLGSGRIAGISGIVGGALGEALSAEPDGATAVAGASSSASSLRLGCAGSSQNRPNATARPACGC